MSVVVDNNTSIIYVNALMSAKAGDKDKDCETELSWGSAVLPRTDRYVASVCRFTVPLQNINVFDNEGAGTQNAIRLFRIRGWNGAGVAPALPVFGVMTR